MKKTIFGVVLIVGIVMSGVLVYAQQNSSEQDQMMQTGKESPKQADTIITEQVINVGNTICPVTGEKIDQETKATYTYEGKEYNLCCAMCIDAFKNDPKKYIEKVSLELSAAQKDTQSAPAKMS